MKNIVNSYVRKFREDRRKSRRAVAMLLALALVVSTGVSWQLHSTGIAMTNETYCGLEEHTHSEDCYEKVLICGLDESEGHTHDESCYDEEGNLTCGQEESAGHTHTEDCYEEQLTCGKEEHTHTIDCMSDESADVETASVWEATLPTLTGDWATDVVAIAESQIGYTESTANFTMDEDGTTRKGYTRYGEWYGNEYGDWDAMFASFCLYYAGVDEDVFPEASGAYAWTAALNKLDLYEGSDYTPAAGDLVFFDTNKDGKADHVGVVTAVTEEKLTAVEGDSNDKVEKNTYSLSDSTILGYGALPELETSEANILLASLASDDGEGTETKDLETYIASVNALTDESASITLELRTESDGAITDTDEDGNTVIKTNTTYHLALTIASSTGFAASTTYTYSLPDYVTVEAASGTITTTEDGAAIGTWSVAADGTVTLTFNESAGDYQNVEITFTATATIDTTATTIVIGGTTYTVSESTSLAVNKSGNYSGYSKDENDYYHGRTWEIEFSQSGVAPAGTVVTDYATDGVDSPLYGSSSSASYNNQYFDTSIPLTFTVVEHDSETVKYTWTVDWDDSNLKLYTLDDSGNVVTTTSTSDRIIGWKYTFPDSVTATDSEGNTVTVDLTKTDWAPYEFRITGCTTYDRIPGTDWPYRCSYYNSVKVNNGVDEGYANSFATQSFGQYDVDKSWTRGEDGVSVNWTVDATIPGDYVRSYELQDYMLIRDSTSTTLSTLVFAEVTSDCEIMIEISDDTTINGTPINAGIYTVYDIDEDVPEDALFVYKAIDSENGSSRFMILGMVCLCDENYCDSWNADGGCKNILYTNSNGVEYCTCWQLDQDSVVYLTYTADATTMMQLLTEWGVGANKIYNWAALRTGTFLNTNIWLGSSNVLDSEIAEVGLALAAKNLTDTPTKENDYTASYKVVINTDHYQLTENDADLTITDTLSSSLTFLENTLVIQATDEAGDTTTLTSSDYSYVYNTETNEVIITIKNPGTNTYTLTYSAQMLNPSAGVTYSNSLKLSWQGEDITVETEEANVSEVTTSGTTYMVTIHKTDATTHENLEDATFALYKEGDTEPMRTGTTGEDGLLTFRTISGSGDEALTFNTHTLYYLVETNAPEGYEENETKYYFYFCDYSGEGDCPTCANMTLPDGVTATVSHTSSISFGITNAQTTYGFTIQKVDADGGGTLTGAEFYVYYESAVLDGDGNPTDEMRQYYAILDDDNAVTDWNSSTAQATKLVVDSDGKVSISGLPAGTYYLEEVTAPDGYNRLAEPVTITIDSSGTITEDSTSVTVSTESDVTTLTVENTAGYELPFTGGSGTWMYTLAGLTLCGGAALLLLRKRWLA